MLLSALNQFQIKILCGLVIYILIAIVVWYILYIYALSKYRKEGLREPFDMYFEYNYEVENVIIAIFWILMLFVYILKMPFVFINRKIKNRYNIK